MGQAVAIHFLLFWLALVVDSNLVLPKYGCKFNVMNPVAHSLQNSTVAVKIELMVSSTDVASRIENDAVLQYRTSKESPSKVIPLQNILESHLELVGLKPGMHTLHLEILHKHSDSPFCDRSSMPVPFYVSAPGRSHGRMLTSADVTSVPISIGGRALSLNFSSADHPGQVVAAFRQLHRLAFDNHHYILNKALEFIMHKNVEEWDARMKMQVCVRFLILMRSGLLSFPCRFPPA